MYREELESRYLIFLEKYNKLINIEYKVMQRMVKRTYIPAINDYAANVASQINEFSACGFDKNIKHQKRILKELLDGLNTTNECLDAANALHDEALTIEDEQEKANHNAHKLLPAMEKLRSSIDTMEHITSRDYWPVPSYNNMLFYV